MGSTDVGSVRHVAGFLVAVAAVLVAAQLVAVGTAGAAESVPVEGTITDEDGAPIESVTVSVEGQETETTEDGTFALEFTYERRGVGRLVATHPAYETGRTTIWASDPQSRNVSMTLSIDEDAPIHQNGTLRGKVYAERGDPVEGATVELTSTDDGSELSVSVETGADGVYELEAPPGNYTLVGSVEGFPDVSRNETISPNVLRITDLQLSTELGLVAGSVTDGAGEPIANATVADAGGEPRTTTNESGGFSLWTAPGERTIVADADGFEPATAAVEVVALEETRRVIVLEANETSEDDEPVEPPDDEPSDEPERDQGEDESGGDEEDNLTGDEPVQAPDASSGPGYVEAMSLLGVFATTLLVLATVAFVRR